MSTELMNLAMVFPPLVRSNHRAIFSSSQACGLVPKVLDEKPKLFQLSVLMPELLTIMKLTSRSSKPVLDIFPPPFGHVAILAVTQINLGAVNLTKLLSIIFVPLCPGYLILWTL